MTYFEAAVTILQECNRPMTAREIMNEVIRRGLLTPSGKTPLYTLSSALYTSMQANPDGPLVRLSDQGPFPRYRSNKEGARARRGSVRWALKPAAEGR